MIPLALITWIIDVSKGRLTQRAVKAIICVLAAILLAAFMWFMIARHDRRVVEQHDAAETIEVLETTGAADENAAATRREDDALIANTTAQIQGAIDNAPAPVAPVSTARAHYYECLRLQRAGKDCTPASR